MKVLIGASAVQIDDRDVGLIDRYPWRVQTVRTKHRTYQYVVAPLYNGGRRKTLVLARELMHPDQGQVVVHLNHDTLDYRRENLLVTDYSVRQLLRRRSTTKRTCEYVGVEPHRTGWRAVLQVAGNYRSKIFKTAEEASRWREAMLAEILRDEIKRAEAA